MTGRTGGAPPARALRLVPHLLVVALGYTLFVVAGVPDLLTTRFGVSLAALGLLTSLPLGAFVLAQPLSGWLADRYPTTRVLLGTSLAHVGLVAALDLVDGFLALLALRFAWGLVAGLLLSVGATHIARLSAGGSATRSQGVYGGMLTMGGAVAFLVGEPVVAATGGFGLHAAGALPALPAGVVCWSHREETHTAPGGGAGAAPGAGATGRDVGPRGNGTVATVTDRTVVLAAVVYVAIIGSYVTLSTFVTAFFDELGGTGPLNALVLVGASVGRAAGGVAVHRLPLEDAELAGAATLAAAVGFGALAYGPGGAVLLALPFATMVAVSVPFGAVFNVAAGATDAEGSALAAVVAAGNVAALVLPPVSGALRESSGSYGVPFAVLAVLNLVALASAVALARGPVRQESTGRP